MRLHYLGLGNHIILNIPADKRVEAWICLAKALGNMLNLRTWCSSNHEQAGPRRMVSGERRSVIREGSWVKEQPMRGECVRDKRIERGGGSFGRKLIVKISKESWDMLNKAILVIMLDETKGWSG